MPTTYSAKWRFAQWLELKWWKNYLSGKDKDQYLIWKKNYWHRFLASINLPVEVLPQACLLDAGCGPAGIFTIFPNNQVTALDPLLLHYEQHLPHFNPQFYPNVRFIAQPIETFADVSCYDMVFCLNAINHVAHIETALNRLVEALKPGGYLVISIDAHKYALLQKIFCLFPADALHPQQFTLQAYQNMLLQNGLIVCSTTCLKRELIFDYWVLVAQKP